MKTVDEYVKMAEEAAGNGAHVAVLMHYRSAVEQAGYGSNSAPVLLAAVQYAQRLKKGDDRAAIAGWGIGALEKIELDNGLEATISQEIAKLQTGGK